MSRYNFSHMQRVLILLAHSLKISTQIPQIILVFHKYFPNYYQNWARTNTCHIITKIWPIQIFFISLPILNYKIIPSLWKPIPIYLVDKTQKAQPIYYKTCCYTTPITKPVVTRHLLQSPREIPCNICKSPSPHLAIFYKIPKYY